MSTAAAIRIPPGSTLPLDYDERLQRGQVLPVDLASFRGALAEARAQGVECAASDAKLLFGAEEVATHLEKRASTIRDRAVNQPAG